MKLRSSVSVIFSILLPTTASTAATVNLITEGFDNITTLATSGWVIKNESSPVGSTSWFQGSDPAVPSQQGASNSYIGANYNSTSGAGTISTWLITPEFAFDGEISVSFFSRDIDDSFADRLEVWLSTSGASTNTSNFDTKILSINESLTSSGYPSSWTEFLETLDGTGGTARLGFRYYVTDGGSSGSNSNYIGLDTFSLTATSSVPEPAASLATSMLLAGGLVLRKRRQAA